MSGTNGPGYSVGTPERIREELREIARRAAEVGDIDRVIEASEEIHRRLRTDPREFGEPMYHLRAMRMEVRNAAIDPLYVEYGVHDDQPVVVIRRVRWLNDPSPA